MSVSGLRVLRGPDWRGGDTDGGEGHVGTVIELLGNHTVRVLWDMGQESTCSAEHDGKCELRVLDTAQIGVRHPNTRCTNCGESDTYGMLWRCRDCIGCDLCPLCYNDDKHDPRHQFLRVDAPGIEGQPVPKRKTSVKHRSLGLFPGSKVTRGRDWQWGDQDGGQGSEGEVKGYENVSPHSSRDLLQVEWPSGNVNSYRVGFHGNVDVTCVEEEVGPYYYRDHLPVLDTDQIRKLSKSIHNASGNPEQPETQEINSGDNHSLVQSDSALLSIPGHNPPESKAPTVSIPGHNPSESKAPTVSIPGHNPPESKAPTVSIPGHNPPESKAPAVCIPGHNSSESKAPTVSIPGHNPPESKVPTVCIPGHNPPESKAPAVCIPGHNPPETKAPTVSIPGHNPPESKSPTVCIPGHNLPESKAPTVSIPGHNPPESKAPTVSIPGHNPPESKAPTVSIPDPRHNPPESKASTVSIPGHNPPESKAPTVSIPGHNPPESKAPTVSIPCHNPPESKAPTVSEADTSTDDPESPRLLIECRTSSCDSDGDPAASVEEIHDISRSEGNKAREEITSADGDALTPGARVAVRVGVEKLLQLQQQCRADTEDLDRVLGKTGHVSGTADDGSVTVKFLAEDVVMNANALVTVQEFKQGDKVRLRDKMEEVKVLNCRVGWRDGMDETAGKVGQVLTVDSEGDLLVSFGRQHFLFAPACCTHVTSDTPVDSLKLDSARMKKPEPNRSWSGARIDINHIAGESKVLFKDLQDTVMSESSRRPSRILSLTSGLHPGRVLHAAQRGDHHTVREMCTANRSLIEFEQQRATPLIVACNYGQREVVRVLLDLGADVNHGVSRSRYPLASLLCSPQKDEEIALMLLDKGADPFGLDESRHTHMHIAAMRNWPRLTKALADRGVDVNAVDDFSDTALHIATRKPSYDVIEVLLAIPSIDLSIKNINNCPALHQACSDGIARAVDMLLDRDKSQVDRMIRTYTALHHAAHSDHADCVRLLVLKGGADVNRGGAPPLNLACVRGMYRAAEALMELGADINCRDVSGNTPLHHVMDGRRVEDHFGQQSDQEIQVRVALACLLVSNGALVDIKDSEGRTPLSCGVPALREGVESFIRKNPELVKRQGGRAHKL
ncbi:E3 ubiquitin-protein ligase MIB2-like [Littorina saxatilis]|uniref:RING-type E3 ubiquitin transferase n=1 Tax=Littorina saxatilis TaxID=31220 RepID=A0AAN9AU61_9CAEN